MGTIAGCQAFGSSASDPPPLAWDGRLDNRRDLAEALGAEPGASDLDLLARAYERWGTGFPARVVGDFALALWDGRERRLVLARDPFGTRPLFYARRNGGIVWASTLRALRAAGVDLGEIEEEWIAGYFSRSIDPALTPWRNARAVPPGCTVILSEGEVRTVRWWRLDAVHPLRLGSDAEYEELFRELFLTAVRRRLRTAKPVTAELSGGLDSSSIVCAADHLLRLGAAEAPDLFTVSHVYERSASADERPYIKKVETRTGRRHRHVLESEAPRLAGLTADALDVPSPSACFRELHRAVFEFMGDNGSRVLLSGLGGDHLLISEVPVPFPLADLLQARELRAFFPALRHWRNELDKPYPQILWEGALCPLLPRPMRLRLAPLPLPIPPWLDRGFVRRWDLAARFAAAVDVEGDFPQPGKRLQAGAVRSVVRALCWMYDRWDYPVEVAYPFLDRDLVELCLGVPGDQLVRPGETRSLLRRSLAGLLPPAIARRRDKRGPDEAVLRAFAERWHEIKDLADEPRAAARGWIDPAAFRQALREARFGKAGDHLPGLLPSLALEAWLRAPIKTSV
jgi:asparagine synthase (glutamine-hydrolysing)